MGLIEDIKRLFKVSTRPGRRDLWLSIKICFLGVCIVGLIGFIIHLVWTQLGY